MKQERTNPSTSTRWTTAVFRKNSSMFVSALSPQLRKKRVMVTTLWTDLRNAFVAASAFAGLGLLLTGGLAGCGGSGGLTASSGAPALASTYAHWLTMGCTGELRGWYICPK